MSHELVDDLLAVLSEYPSISNYNELFQHKVHQVITRSLPEKIRSIFFPEGISDFKIEGHDGNGVKAHVPWIGILNKKLSPDPKRGIYIAILFSRDGEYVNISIQQGTENVSSLKEIKRRTQVVLDFLRRHIPSLDSNDLILQSKSGRPKKYVAANIYAHILTKAQVADFESSLKKVFSVYEKMLKLIPDIDAYNRVVALDQDFLSASSKNTHFFGEITQVFLKNIDLYFTRDSISSFVNSILAKPFVILTGLSGSGKTLLALAFAKWICEDSSQYALIPVAANWTSKEDLLGYPDALDRGRYIKTAAMELVLRASKDPANPYFLILDEMNLSHVERYFSDFLSAMESGERIPLHDDTGEDWPAEPGGEKCVPAYLEIPRNLFIIGTVNVDETTYMFSPKVLDRANVIEFRAESDQVMDFLAKPSEVNLAAIAGNGASFARDLVAKANMRMGVDFSLDEDTAGDLKRELKSLFDILSKHEAEFGFRTAKEISRFVYFHKLLAGDDASLGLKDAIDAQIMQKILPKLHGSQKKLRPVLEGLGQFCLTEDHAKSDWLKEIPLDKRFEEIQSNKGKEGVEAKYCPMSFEKIIRMMRKLSRDGFASFAEN